MPHIHDLYDFTVSALILHPTKPQLLFLLHRKLGSWLQPGGHVELNEDPIMALHHELEEETGLRQDQYKFVDQDDYLEINEKGLKTLPRPFHLNVHDYNSTHKHIDIMYLVQAHTDKVIDNPDGADEISWLSLADAVRLHSEGKMLDNTLRIFQFVADRYF